MQRSLQNGRQRFSGLQTDISPHWGQRTCGGVDPAAFKAKMAMAKISGIDCAAKVCIFIVIRGYPCSYPVQGRRSGFYPQPTIRDHHKLTPLLPLHFAVVKKDCIRVICLFGRATFNHVE